MKLRWQLSRGHLAGNFAFLVTAVAAFASMLASGGGPLLGPNGPLLLALGVGYLVVGQVGITLVGSGSPLWQGLLYFALELSLTSAILYISRLDGFISLLLLPLVSNALEMLPRRWAVLMC